MEPQLNERIDAAAQKWHVRCDRVVETVTSILAFGSRHDQPVVLKIIRQPGDEWYAGAAAAAFQGNGMVNVIAHEPGAVLMERLQPGTQLTDVVLADDDARACAAIADVIGQMQNVEPDRVLGVTAQTWGEAFDGYLTRGDQPLDAGLVIDARQLYAHLCATQKRPRLLHGDLQHYNILYDERRGWTAIDPKGVVAELEFEFGRALRNPQAAGLYANSRVVEQRMRMMSAGLQVDLQRVRHWAFAQAVLSAIWTVEDDGALTDDDPALQLARVLRPA